MNKKVLVIGELNVDLILSDISGPITLGKEVVSDQMQMVLGSSSAIFANNLCALGDELTFLGKVGKDHFGKFVVEQLSRSGVNTTYIQEDDLLATGITVILHYPEDRALATFPGAMLSMDYNNVPDAAFDGIDHLHVSSIFLQKGLKPDIHKLFAAAKQAGLTTSLDPQWDPEEKWDLDYDALWPHLDIFLPNKSEFLAMTKTTSLSEGIEKLPSNLQTLIAIKDGAMGAHAILGGEQTYKSAYINDEVVDTIGAGDSFDAGFIYKFIRQKPFHECFDFANLMGAINTTRAGGTAAFQSLSQIKQIALTQFDTEL